MAFRCNRNICFITVILEAVISEEKCLANEFIKLSRRTFILRPSFPFSTIPYQSEDDDFIPPMLNFCVTFFS